MTSGGWEDSGRARRVRIYVSEEDRTTRAPSHHAIVAFLREHDAAGVTLFRATEGFGASGRIHSARLADVAWDLPVVIEWVDTPERVELLLPELTKLVPPGLVTVEPTEVVLFARSRIRELSEARQVSSVMTREVVTARRDTPVREVVESMLGRTLRSIPVVEDGIVVGMITSSDLVRRAELGVRVTLIPGLAPDDRARKVESLPKRVAADVMTAPATVVREDASLSAAAKLMVQRKLKRLPVVNDAGRLVGIVSRVDLLRTVAGFATQGQAERGFTGLAGECPVSAVMRDDVPVLYADSPLDDVVQAVIATRLNRALVLDAERRVLGVVTARAVLERVTPTLHPTLLRSLVQRLPFLRPVQEEREAAKHASATTAAELMNPDVLTARADEPLRDVLAEMIEGGRKVVAVVDGDRRLLGVVDRADVLRGALQEMV